MSFSQNWLDARQKFDNDARDLSIEQKAVCHFSKNVSIMDVGTGTGNNFFYYQKKFPLAKWVLADNDADLLDSCLKRVENIEKVTIKNCSILNLEDDLHGIDLIIANAIFDLFSLSQFTSFASQVCDKKISFLTTLNYQKMFFSPELPMDSIFIEFYEKHMERKQDFGYAMGRSCSQNMIKILADTFFYQVHTEDSNWLISNKKDSAMMQFILQFMEDSIKELVPNKNIFSKWLQEKKEMQDLELHINHTDIFAHP